jgi:hypothetical protein
MFGDVDFIFINLNFDFSLIIYFNLLRHILKDFWYELVGSFVNKLNWPVVIRSWIFGHSHYDHSHYTTCWLSDGIFNIYLFNTGQPGQ